MKVKVSTIWERWKKTKKVLGYQAQYEEIGGALERLVGAIRRRNAENTERALKNHRLPSEESDAVLFIDDYAPIETSDATGGNQGWFTDYSLSDISMNQCGCGVIAAADLILYLEGRKVSSTDAYLVFVKTLQRKYFPLIPKIGMPWFELVWGLNLYFRREKLPYRASYGVRPWKFKKRIRDLLKRRIPVILGIGQNIPPLLHDEMLTFYKKSAAGSFVPSCYTRAHFVTVLGMEGDYLRITSWGEEYYISIGEYKKYVHKFSSWLVCGIIQIR